MIIDILTTNSNNFTLNKNYVTLHSNIQCNVYESCDIYSPQLILSYEIIKNSNLIFIHDFNRFYHIENKIVNPGKQCIIYCVCDVLMSFKNDILNSQQMIVRYSDYKDPRVFKSRVIDNKLLVSQRKLKNSFVLKNGEIMTNVNNILQFIVTTLGGSGSPSERD